MTLVALNTLSPSMIGFFDEVVIPAALKKKVLYIGGGAVDMDLVPSPAPFKAIKNNRIAQSLPYSDSRLAMRL